MKTQTKNTTEAISNKIAGDGKQSEKLSPVQVLVPEARKMGEALGITQERLTIIGTRAGDALKAYMELPGKERSKARLLSEACELCDNYNEVAYMCYMLGSQIEQMPAMAELAAMAMLGGSSKPKGGIIIGL